ncbi:MAG: hypothetical protein WBQ76_17415 [Candidatus Korobacteraceae bacterium]
MSKKARRPGARPTTVYLTPLDSLVLATIEQRRSSREEPGDSPSEIIADAIVRYLEEVEKVPLQNVQVLLPPKPKNDEQSNIKPFPKK